MLLPVCDNMISSDTAFQNMFNPLVSFFLTSLLAILIRWRFFPTPPAAFANAFDPLLCASLHNQIAEILTPTAHAMNNTLVRNLFKLPGEEGKRARALRRRLSQEMVIFFSNTVFPVSHIPGAGGGPIIGFTPDLKFPCTWMFEQLIHLDYSEAEDRYLVLYGSKPFHPSVKRSESKC